MLYKINKFFLQSISVLCSEQSLMLCHARSRRGDWQNGCMCTQYTFLTWIVQIAVEFILVRVQEHVQFVASWPVVTRSPHLMHDAIDYNDPRLRYTRRERADFSSPFRWWGTARRAGIVIHVSFVVGLQNHDEELSWWFVQSWAKMATVIAKY